MLRTGQRKVLAEYVGDQPALYTVVVYGGARVSMQKMMPHSTMEIKHLEYNQKIKTVEVKCAWKEDIEHLQEGDVVFSIDPVYELRLINQ